jgi:D-glycero-D-manno-heptose 1,7-bisphosphate phosphatase
LEVRQIMDRIDALEPDGIWCERPRGGPSGVAPRGVPRAAARPALFLDRDGVVTEEVHFLRRPEDVVLCPGAARVIARANTLDVAAVLVTNQSGIARGLFDWAAFAATQARLYELLAAEGAALDLVLACPYHPDGRPPYGREHPCRKPAPGMLLRAAERMAIDLAASWTVGDRARDLQAGRAAGLAGGLHVLSGHGHAERADAAALGDDGFELRLGDGVLDVLALPILA